MGTLPLDFEAIVLFTTSREDKYNVRRMHLESEFSLKLPLESQPLESWTEAPVP